VALRQVKKGEDLSNFREAIYKKNFVLTAECFLRPETDAEAISLQADVLRESIDAVILTDKIMDHWQAVLPGRVLRVQYEDVVADLEGQVRQILGFCGLGWEDSCLDFHKNTRPVNTVSAEQVREPIYTDAVEFWKHYESQLEPVREILAPVLQAD
jgi:hypothetical protein